MGPRQKRESRCSKVRVKFLAKDLKALGGLCEDGVTRRMSFFYFSVSVLVVRVCSWVRVIILSWPWMTTNSKKEELEAVGELRETEVCYLHIQLMRTNV